MRIFWLIVRSVWIEMRIRKAKWDQARIKARINLIQNRINQYNEIHL